MADEYIKTKDFASKVEDMLRAKEKRNFKTKPFDYESFLNEIKLPEVLSEAPDPDPILMLKSGIPDTVVDGLEKAEYKAALSGKFNPTELFNKKTAIAYKRTVLSALSVNCHIESIKKVEWQLTGKRRTTLLNKLITTHQLEEQLKLPLPATDIFGKLLRLVLQEKANFSIENLKQEEIIELANVLETLEEVNFPKPAITEVKAKIQIPGLLDEYAAISEGFIGREKELFELNNFMTHDRSAKKLPWAMEGIVVTGIGGVGKSTLLAKFVNDLVDKNLATVVILDFDRPGFNATDPVWMVQEFCRQIGMQYPHSKDKMMEIRNKTRENRNKYSLDKSSVSDVDQAGELASSIAYEIRIALTDLGFGDNPFLLVLDTLEEVAQNHEIPILLDLLSRISSSFAPINIKIIFSGRLYDEQLAGFTAISYIKNKPIEVNEFDSDIATKFLLNQELTKAMANKIIRSGLIPLRPLELKLLAKSLKEGRLSFNALSKELQQAKGKKSTKSLFTGIIYRRVLMRIKDKQVREIAYPGLILRYITPEIIMNVLQPALRLKKMNVSEATILANKLGTLNWLAYTDSKGRIWHRKDLRRSMLQLMLQQDEKITQAIRNQALDYFSASKGDEGSAEYVYHHLMHIQKNERFYDRDLVPIRKAYSYICMDAIDLSPKARAILNYAGGQTLSLKELYLLPGNYLLVASEQVGKQMVSDRKFNEAYKLAKGAGILFRVIKSHNSEELLDNWMYEALYSLVEWKSLHFNRNIPLNPDKPSLVSLVNEVFPFAITSLAKMYATNLEVLLSLIVKNKFQFGQVTQKANQIQVMARLSVCLVILHHYKKLNRGAISALKEIINPNIIPGPTPTLQKALCLLNMIWANRPLDFYSPGTSLLRLDHQWLKELARLLPKNKRNLVAETHAQLYTDKKEPPTARTFLSRINSFTDGRKEWHEVQIKLKGMSGNKLYNLFKGPDPIFRDPIRYALLDAFTTPYDYAILADLFTKAIPFVLHDTHDYDLHVYLSDNRELALEPYIEIIDRCWNLDKFLKAACKAKPKAKKLREVRQAYDRWQLALKTICLKTLH